MDYKETAPTAQGHAAGAEANESCVCAAKVRNFTGKQRKVWQMLQGGGKYSVADISARLHLCDPRKHIQALRRKGVAVLDEWRQCGGGRYKVYFINGGQTL